MSADCGIPSVSPFQKHSPDLLTHHEMGRERPQKWNKIEWDGRNARGMLQGWDGKTKALGMEWERLQEQEWVQECHKVFGI